MKQKTLSIAVTLSWFAFIGVWYLLYALVLKIELFSILSNPPLKDQLLGCVLVCLPPLGWWIPRRLLIQSSKWHRIGTIVFCIGITGLFLAGCLLMLVANHVPALEQTAFWKTFLDPIAFYGLQLVYIVLFVCEVLFALFHRACRE